MAGNSWYEAAKGGISLASTYINAAYTQAVDTASHLTKKAGEDKQKQKAKKDVPLESQEGELAQSSTPDPTGKMSLNHVNRCASLLDEGDVDEWDDAYIRPGIVNYDKAQAEINGFLVENGEWVYLLGPDRQ